MLGLGTGQAWAQPRLPALSYQAIWRLIRAGTVTIDTGEAESRVKIDSAGLVSALYKVDDTYTVRADERHCVQATWLDAKQGNRHRLAEVNYEKGRARYSERDVLKDTVLRKAETEVPGCVHEVFSGIQLLRGMHLEPGQSTLVPMSDGRRAGQVKVEAQAREDVVTPSGTFHTIRYETFLMNGVIYPRNGHVHVWLTDDERRVPVQIRMRLAFPIGTVLLQLEKQGKP